MRRITTSGLLLLVGLAISATAPGLASATKLTLSAGGATLQPGGEGEAFGGEMSVNTSSGELICPRRESGFFFNVLTNSKTADELKINQLTGGFADGHQCESYFGLGYAYPNLLSKGLLKLRGSGVATLEPVTFRITFEHPSHGENTQCIYERKAIRGTNTASPTREDLEINFENQRLPLIRSASNSKECPKEAFISLGVFFAGYEYEGGEPFIEEQTTTL
jgi:hypothetical protein